MPVELTITETEVILESSSAPGPAGAAGADGVGVPVGGGDGQVLAKASATDFDTEWVDQTGGGGGVTDADYLVGTSQGGLSAEIVVGTSPGGELGGSWASPTVDGTHSGSSHATVQSAAEATAAAALAAHEADTTNIHGIADTANLQPLDSDLTAIAALTTTAYGRALLELADEAALKAGLNLEAGTDYPSQSTFDDHSTRHEDGGADEISIAGLAGTSTALQAHLDDSSDAHDASAVSVADSGTFYTATDVEGVLAEIAPQLGGGGAPDPVFDAFGTPDTAFEFETSSLAGLTAIGTPDVEDADTSVPGCYFIQDNAGANAYFGRYVAATVPFTVIGKISDCVLVNNFHMLGILVGVADPATGAFVNWGIVNDNRTLQRNAWTDRTNPGSSTSYGFNQILAPFYLAIRANSSSDLDLLISAGGQTWAKVQDSVNPGITIASAGMGIAPISSGTPVAMVLDFLRIWDSALAMPGAEA